MNDEYRWMEFKRTPEQTYSMRESGDRRYRWYVWNILNHVPPSLREQYYLQLPNYLCDKVRDRVKEIERLKRRKRGKS